MKGWDVGLKGVVAKMKPSKPNQPNTQRRKQMIKNVVVTKPGQGPKVFEVKSIKRSNNYTQKV